MKKGTIDKKMIFFWIPRVLGIAFCIIMELFILLSHGFTVVALIENLIIMILFIALILAWRWPFHGGIGYVVLSIAYFVMVGRRGAIEMGLTLSIPLFITGVLFILDWEFRKR